MAFNNTFATYLGSTGGGTQTDFAIPFTYQSQSEVIVTRAGGSVTYTFPSAGLIRLSSALAVGDSLSIARDTSVSSPSVTYSNGGSVTGTLLNRTVRQLLNALQEMKDYLTMTIKINTLNQYEGNSKRIVNLANPVNDQDAATKSWVLSNIISLGKAFYENDQTVNYDYTITSGKNALSVGPITIATGVTLTISTGSTWSII